MTSAQLLAAQSALSLGLLLVGWMLLRGFVGELKATRDIVAKGQECWDEASVLAIKADRSVDLLEPRVTRLEGHDFNRLNSDVNSVFGRVGRVELDIQEINRRLGEMHGMTVETNTIVKELRNRRRADREDG